FHTHAPFGGAPLSMLAMTQSRAPLLPVARLGGMLLVGLAVTAVGAALHVAMVERRWKEPVGVLVGCAVLVALAAVPTWSGRGDRTERTIRIAAVQGGGPQGTRYSSEQVPEVF